MMRIVYNHLKDRKVPIVIDPVMVATSGDTLINKNARQFLIEKLLPLARVVTPNLPETEYLIGKQVATHDDMKRAAQLIVNDFGAQAALVKGGHLKGNATDILYDGHTSSFHILSEQRIDTTNT